MLEVGQESGCAVKDMRFLCVHEGGAEALNFLYWKRWAEVRKKKGVWAYCGKASGSVVLISCYRMNCAGRRWSSLLALKCFP